MKKYVEGMLLPDDGREDGMREGPGASHSKPKSRGDSLLTDRMEEKDKRRSNRQQIDDKKNKQTIQAST
jgi:hypothetical protein